MEMINDNMLKKTEITGVDQCERTLPPEYPFEDLDV